MLELPPTIRQLRSDEIPNRPEVIELINKQKTAKIVEGFRLSLNEANKLPFKFYALINIDNSRLWSLFVNLTSNMPDKIAAIFNPRDADPFYGAYMPKETVINILSRYELEITQDGSLELGVIFNTEEKLEEVFISHAKYIQFWGVNEISFRQAMRKFNLDEIEDIAFIDEFPKAVESLRLMHNSKAKETGIVINELQNAFKARDKKAWWKLW
jgi:hypothetical protein